jgi:hypothetical protein
MKVSTLVLCTLAVVLWVGVSARAEGKGKTSGDKTTVQERDAKADQGQGKAQAGDVKGDKGGKGGQGEKQTGPQGKRTGQATEAAEKGKGKGQDQQAQALQKQLQHESDKHKDRLAKLNRIRELAAKKNDAETIARVDKLIAKENEVYARKLQQLQGQPRATPQLQLPAGAGKAAEKAVEKTAVPAVTPAPSTTPAPGAPEAPKEEPAEQPKEEKKEQK